MLAIIKPLDMTENARRLAMKTFIILAEAEARAHGKTRDEVHFHEVGALDSIVDVVSAAVCFDDLGITEVIIPKLCEGKGTIRCAHGILPIPVPAVMNVAAGYHLPIQITDLQGELITPTGAAFAAAVMTSDRLPETFYTEAIGYGAGKRKYEWPSILRAMLIRPADGSMEGSYISSGKTSSDNIIKLECNIDDSTGEQLGYCMEQLMEAGARDVFYTAIQMKKNRPAYLLSVITDDSHLSEMERIIFTETTTIGIRRQRLERHVMPRKQEEVDTGYGRVIVKVCEENGILKAAPEYESVAKAAKKAGVSFSRVF